MTVWSIAFTLLAVSAAAVPGERGTDAPGRQVRDLARASLPGASGGIPVWNDHARVTRGPENRPEIVPPFPIMPGRFAVGRFRGEELSWAGYDTLVLEVRSKVEGRLMILFSEYDGEQREDFTFLVESLPAGESTLRVTLKAEPEGDLTLSSQGGDGVWNPDEDTGVNMILGNYPKGFVIEGLQLEMSEISEGATK
jgi:hypothetical protein